MNEPTLFDMSEIDTEVILSTERAKLMLKRTAEDIIAIGKELIFIKSKLKHGQFMPWVEHHFEMTRHTAFNFMNVAERFGSNVEIFNISPSILYELASPSTPDSLVEEVTSRIESGEKISFKEVQELKRQAKEAEQEKERIHKELSVNKQMVNFLKKDIEEFNHERDQLKKELEKLQAIAAQPVVKEVEVVKEVQVIKEVPVIPDGYASIEKAIAEKQARLKELEKEEKVKLENRRILMIDIHDLQERMNAGNDKRNATIRAIRQIIGRLRFALGEIAAHSIKVDPLFVDDSDLDELSKAITGINDIYREIMTGKNMPVDPNLSHNSMKAVQIVSI